MNSLFILKHFQATPAQDAAGGYGLPAWAWFLIITLIILLVWWLLVRSAERQNEIQIHHESSHTAEPGEPLTASAVETIPQIPAEPDDLTIIEGIGPKVSEVLVNTGINTYKKLAETEVGKLNQILESAGYKYMDPGTWPEQARLLDEGEKEEFKKYVQSLKGGKKR